MARSPSRSLPFSAMAQIDRRKLTDYLLSPTHPLGRTKAAFFSGFGFTPTEPGALESALLDHAARCDVITQIQTSFGIKYVFEGALLSPDGRNPVVRVIWFIGQTNAVPILVTAYPGQQSRRGDAI